MACEADELAKGTGQDKPVKDVNTAYDRQHGTYKPLENYPTDTKQPPGPYVPFKLNGG